jgi:hypothetical protein
VSRIWWRRWLRNTDLTRMDAAAFAPEMQMYMIDESTGSIYEIPRESIISFHPTATSCMKYAIWCEHVLNAKQDVYAYTNAEMIVSISQSSSPTCILKHSDTNEYIYAQVIELKNAPIELCEYGVNPQKLGGSFLWPLSYNQHDLVWRKVCSRGASSGMSGYPPILNPDVSACSLRAPCMRPRPWDVFGAREAASTTLSGTDRFSALLFPVSPFLFRDGRARRDRYSRAIGKYVEQQPIRTAHKKRVAIEMTSRKRSDRHELRELYVENSKNCSITRFIRNVPIAINDLRTISGVHENGFADCASSSKRRLVTPPATAPRSAVCFEGLPHDVQCLILRRACTSILSTPDIGLSKQRTRDLLLVSKAFNKIVTDELYASITGMLYRIVGSITDGNFDPYMACVHSYRQLSCPPHSLLEVHASLSLGGITKLNIVKRYFRSRSRSNVSPRVCSARALPLNGSSLTHSTSASDLEDAFLGCPYDRGSAEIHAVPRLDELWGVYSSSFEV